MSFDDFTATTYKSLGYLRAVDTLIYNIQYHFLVYEVADILGILQYKCHVLYPSFDLPTTYCFHRTYFEPLSKYKVIGKEKYFSLIFRNREFHNCKKEKKNWKAKTRENVWTASTEPAVAYLVVPSLIFLLTRKHGPFLQF